MKRHGQLGTDIESPATGRQHISRALHFRLYQTGSFRPCRFERDSSEIIYVRRAGK